MESQPHSLQSNAVIDVNDASGPVSVTVPQQNNSDAMNGQNVRMNPLPETNILVNDASDTHAQTFDDCFAAAQ